MDLHAICHVRRLVVVDVVIGNTGIVHVHLVITVKSVIRFVHDSVMVVIVVTYAIVRKNIQKVANQRYELFRIINSTHLIRDIFYDDNNNK